MSYFEDNNIHSPGDLILSFGAFCLGSPLLNILTSIHYEGSDSNKLVLGLLTFIPGLIVGPVLLTTGGIIKIVEFPFKYVIKSFSKGSKYLSNIFI